MKQKPKNKISYEMFALAKNGEPSLRQLYYSADEAEGAMNNEKKTKPYIQFSIIPVTVISNER